jgi:hypothetical protein
MQPSGRLRREAAAKRCLRSDWVAPAAALVSLPVAWVACVMPARRASRVDPTIAPREE